MKRLLPVLLALLVLLTACGKASPEAQAPSPSPDGQDPVPGEEAAPDDGTDPASGDGLDENELPILIAGDPAPADETQTPPALSDTAVTLDGISSYLRLRLAEGWTWEQGEGPKEIELIVLRPSDDPDFVVEMRLWNDGFAMCGTDVTIQDYTLPDGRTATLAYEIINEIMRWTLILPESPDAFTIQFCQPYDRYEAHRAELELMLGTIQQGVRAELDAAPSEEATG